MADKSIRFGVFDGGDNRASTWLLKVSPPDSLEIYLINRHLRSDLKISMHQSGEWHWALTEETYQERPDLVPESADEGKKIVKWLRPEETVPGFTVAQRILVPHLAVNTPISERDRNRIDTWIPNAPEGKVTEIIILITNAEVQVERWEEGANVVGNLDLSNGDTLWVISFVTDMPEFKQDPSASIMVDKEKKKEIEEAENLRALGFLDAPDGSKILLDSIVKT